LNKLCISASEEDGSTSNKAVGVIVLNEYDTKCQVCTYEFLAEDVDMNKIDDSAKLRLPVISSCYHVCCYGCILSRQRALAKENSGAVPELIDCMKCRHVAAFRPDEPKFDWRLIYLLSRYIPLERETQS
jgi:hypothetical protein